MSGWWKAALAGLGGLILLVVFVGWRNAVSEERTREEAEIRKRAEKAEHEKELAKVAEIEARLAELVPECLRLPAGTPIRRREKVVYWRQPDQPDKYPTIEADRKLRLSRQLREAGGACTLVWPVEKINLVQVRTYFPDIPGYKADLKVCVFDWPSLRPVGWAVVEGHSPEPELLGSKDQREVYGEIPVEEWIDKLPSGEGQ
jgi:hypothetical protein